MLSSIIATIPRPSSYDDRARRLSVLQAVLDGTMYDGLKFEFSQEKAYSGEYIPLNQRKPSVRYNLCRLVVDDATAMLFGSGRFPTVMSDHADTQTALFDVFDESAFSEAMVSAAMVGSVGSVVVMMRILGNRVFWSVMPTLCLTPTWNPKAPDTLDKLTERYQVRGDTLAAQGYAIAEPQHSSVFWFQREWDAAAETWYLPLLVSDADRGKLPKIDRKNTVKHGLGFVPAVWIKNLPGGAGDDGCCTFQAAIETQVEIEYRLSQGGRALHYASDPLMLIRDPSGDTTGNMLRSASNAIVLGQDGDAKLLQIDGGATTAVLEFVRDLREFGIEQIHGNKASADRMAAAQSGRAMEIMREPTISMVDNLRQSYGRAVLRLARMVVLTQSKIRLTAFDVSLPTMKPSSTLKLRWGPYFAPTLNDKLVLAQTLTQLHQDGIISRESAVQRVCEIEAIPDAVAELARIDSDMAKQTTRLNAQGDVTVQAKLTEEA